MKSALSLTATAGLTGALMMASSAFAVALPSTQDFGRATDGAFAERVIMLTPDIQSIGVYRNQTVRFVDAASGRSVTWRFDTAATGFDLEQILPGAGRVKTYVWDTGRQSG